jgi:hypothetical protein
LRPDWLHDHLRLELAKDVVYQFRTLSLYDVWALWPHLLPLKEAIEKGRPMAWAEHLAELVRVLNPTLADVPEHVALIRAAHVDYLLEFYLRQDWPRIGMLGGFISPEDRKAAKETMEREPVGGTDTDRRFMAICTAAAHSVSMSPLEFMQERFEFCADVIVNYRTALEEEKTRGKMSHDQFFGLMGNVLPRARVVDESKPAWMREVEEYAKNAENN